MAERYEDFEDRVADGAKKYVRRKARRQVKRLNGFTLFFCILALAAGIAVGIGAYSFICNGDRFEVNGQKEYEIALGSESFVYNDRGATVIEFGKDISDKVTVETNMQDLGGGKYTADTTVPGKYYIKYTVESHKYGEVCRIRTFVVGGEG